MRTPLILSLTCYTVGGTGRVPRPRVRSSMRATLTILCLFVLVAGTAPAVYSRAAESDSTGTGSPADTTTAFPDKEPSRSTWENVVAAPGYLVYLPFWLLFEFTEFGIGAWEAWGFVPQVQGVLPTYSARGGAGLKFYKRNIPNEGAQADATGTLWLEGRSMLRLRWRDVRVGALNTNWIAIYRNMPTEPFFGIGPDTQKSDETNYLLERVGFTFSLGKLFKEDRVQLGFIFNFDHNDTGPGKGDTPSTTDETQYANLPGLEDEVNVGRVELGLLWDGRNRKRRPLSGFDLFTTIGGGFDMNGSEYGWSEFFVDANWYFTPFRDRVIKLRVGGRFTDPFSDREIPFYYLPELGETETIRGYQRARFRDQDAVLATFEYRYPVNRAIDVVLFADGGQVFGPSTKLAWDSMAWGVGAGIIVWSSDEAMLHGGVGISSERVRWYLAWN